MVIYLHKAKEARRGRVQEKGLPELCHSRVGFTAVTEEAVGALC
jgi:hypothetical protein